MVIWTDTGVKAQLVLLFFWDAFLLLFSLLLLYKIFLSLSFLPLYRHKEKGCQNGDAGVLGDHTREMRNTYFIYVRRRKKKKYIFIHRK